MKELPDIAATLFTTDYRAVKLKNKPKRHNAPGTGSCFDVTDPEAVRNASLKATLASLRAPAAEEPVWDPATSSYRLRATKEGPSDFVRAGSGRLRGSQKRPRPQPSAPVAGAFKPRENLADTAFRRAYERGDLPICIEHHGLKNLIKWRVDINSLDIAQLLPLFFDGIRETQEPFRFLAVKGCEDLLKAGGEAVLRALPHLVQPLKRALNTRDKLVVIVSLKLLQKLVVSHEAVGPALVPYYRQLLPVCNLFARSNHSLGDAIDYAQHEGLCLGEVIQDTLALLEIHGGPDAFINLKYIVPTYESVRGS